MKKSILSIKPILVMIALILVGGIFTALLSGGLMVKDAWARPGAAGDNSAVYFVINNRSTSQDHLLSAASDVAAVTQVHQTTIDASGKASMAEQAVLTVPTRSQVDFKPGGLHVMLMDLKKDLKPGDSVPLTLTFEQAGTVKIEAEVREP